ncbi:CsiV family protein [Pseudomonas sp. 5Ae-yellow]|uniref:CsiV family protein n=1 Tax=Pseudomonas sp. 5Ae-yellow TaxID=2759848 RepID=UPI0015F64A01|nr:CsiV family protein [Pseudomonas sp. 5Ae-yellow]MBA6418759.1 hypothetical protein [Pseudomonas sp. 5Ae-yellow]|tara:strand:+ start:1651 stop:2217 length:567 start_codon:yes stop_codon:yes gene_type:complete
MKHLYKKLSLLVLATLVSTMTMAQSAGEYLVEVVFFGQPSASLVMGTPPDLDWADNAVKLDETARSDVQSIDPTRFRLSQEARKLEQNGYQIYLHQAWTQPLDNDLDVALSKGEADNGIYPIQGLVNLSKDNLMEIAVSFWHNRKASDLQMSGASIVSENLHQRRPLRLNETHYLDHQSLGMLVRVSR